MATSKCTNRKITLPVLWKQRQLLLMSIPFVIYIIIFNYLPVWGWLIAFQNFNPARHILAQEWVGLKHFKFLITDESFLRIFRNTVAMSFINIVLSFSTAITFALLLNEIKNIKFKRVIQTISYIPHFIALSVVAGLVQSMLSLNGGLNQLLLALGLIDEPILFLGKGEYFWTIFGITNVWKELGWNAIIYLAAIAGINPSLYESASIDGAGRFRKMWYITLPCLMPTITILLILNIGNLVSSAGFELQYLLSNGLNKDYSEVIQMFVLKYGMALGNYSLATAAGIFQSIISVVLIIVANSLAKKFGNNALY